MNDNHRNPPIPGPITKRVLNNRNNLRPHPRITRVVHFYHNCQMTAVYGPWVACTHQHLVTAVRFLIVQRRLAMLRAAAPEVDSTSIEQQLKVIRTALARIRTMKTKLTELGSCTHAIDEQADHLTGEIKEALSSIEDSLRAG